MNDMLRTTSLTPEIIVRLVQGDITQEKVEATVNTPNRQLQHGGGVAATISRTGESHIQQKSDDWIEEPGPVIPANPAFPTGGERHCTYVIHAVSPRWESREEDRRMHETVTGSQPVANGLNSKSRPLPALSTGIFGFPKKREAQVILHATEPHAAGHPQSGVNLSDQPTVDAFTTMWDKELL